MDPYYFILFKSNLEQDEKHRIAAMIMKHEKQLKALQEDHERRMREMRATVEEERANRDALVHAQMGAAHLAATYGEQCFLLQKNLAEGQNYLDILGADEAVRTAFDETHGSLAMVAPMSATEEDIASIKEAVANISEVTERLQARAESDGIFCALLALCVRKGWPQDPSNIAKRVMESGADFQQFQLQRQRSYTNAGALTPVELPKLKEWLLENEVSYTPEGLAYMLQAMGTSTAAAEEGKPIDVARWVQAFKDNPTASNALDQLSVTTATQRAQPRPGMLKRDKSELRPECVSCGSRMIAGYRDEASGEWRCAKCCDTSMGAVPEHLAVSM